MSDIFMSYAAEDIQIAKRITRILQERHFDVWWDRQNISAGVEFDHSIQDAIHETKCCIILWSETSVESGWVRAEAEECDRLRKRIIPVLLQAGVAIPLRYRMINAVRLDDFRDGESSADIELLLDSLHKALESEENSSSEALRWVAVLEDFRSKHLSDKAYIYAHRKKIEYAMGRVVEIVNRVYPHVPLAELPGAGQILDILRAVPDEELREDCIEAIFNLGSNEDRNVKRAIYDIVVKRDSRPRVKYAAERALARLGFSEGKRS